MQTAEKYTESGLFNAASPSEATSIQDALRHRCVVKRIIGSATIRHVAGADAAYDQEMVYAAVAVLTFPALELVETAGTARTIPFPYIPGLLAFREGPALLEAFGKITTVPDLIIINGHGVAHPRRFGIASHIGLALDLPSIGIAQRLLTGTAVAPENPRGSATPVLDREEVIGMAVRTVAGQRPVFVSAGHKVDLEQAVGLALGTTVCHRITEPVWQADRMSRQCRDSRQGP